MTQQVPDKRMSKMKFAQ